MNIIAKKTFLFVKDEIKSEPTVTEGMARVQVIEDTFTLQKSDEPQAVPDWVKDTDLYKAALKEKSVIATVDQAPDEDEKDEKKSKPKAGAGTGLPTHQPGWNKS